MGGGGGLMCILDSETVVATSSKLSRAIIQLIVESNDLNTRCGGRVPIKFYSGRCFI